MTVISSPTRSVNMDTADDWAADVALPICLPPIYKIKKQKIPDVVPVLAPFDEVVDP